METVPLCTDVPLFWLSTPQHNGTFGPKFPFLVGNVRRFAYPDTSGPERAKCTAAPPPSLGDRGRLARIFWFLNTIRRARRPRSQEGREGAASQIHRGVET
jgi:hypothetical protein